MTTDLASLVSDNLVVWTGAVERKSSAGRGNGKRVSLYGIERLRALIIDLAVHGKLVSQRSDEEPASAALTKLATARREKLTAGQAKKSKPLAPPPANLPPLPSGWAWSQLGTIAEISPSNAADDGLAASFVPMALVSTRIDGVHEAEVRTWSEIKKGFTHFADGDIGLAKITPCFENGKAALFQNLTNGIGAGTTELHVARPWSNDVNRRYLLLTMKTASYLREGEAKMTGTAGQKRVTRTYFETAPLPLPPLAEQQRIVAKVDELMALCDALEEEGAAAMAAHQTLLETLLATLTASADAAELATNWQRLETHFNSLFTTEASVDALETTLLELAVSGKLVAQNTNDEPVSTLLERLPSKGSRNLQDVDVWPGAIPNGWESLKLEQIIGPMDSGWSPACEEVPASSEEAWGVLKTTAVQSLRYDEGQNKELPAKLDPRPAAEAKEGDILITRAGPTNRVGICCYVAKTRPRLMISDKIIRFRPALPEISGEYVALALSAGPAARQIEKAKSGMAASQVNISQAKLKEIWLLLPPAPEQVRIIKRVNELMSLCAALKSRIAAAATTQMHLADAIVERAAA